MAEEQHVALIWLMYTTNMTKCTWNMLQSGPLKALYTDVMLMVSKQRVIRHKLNTDVNLTFSEMSGSYNHLQGKKKKN